MQRATGLVVLWLAIGLLCIAALVAAVSSPLLQWREPIYILAGFAGILGLVFIVFQPLLATATFPGLPHRTQLRMHRFLGALIVAAVVLHVGGLWITSPPDVVDALLFVSPTWFSPFGVTAMWAVFLTALLLVLYKRRYLALATWKKVHLHLLWVIVPGTVVHAILIEGMMESYTKAALCLLAILFLIRVSIVR